jgi:hypothetical protein
MTQMMIGKRVPVDNLRTLWAKEHEFSDWLASPEGIELLAQDMEIQIENPKREEKGNNFPCDIVPTWWVMKTHCCNRKSIWKNQSRSLSQVTYLCSSPKSYDGYLDSGGSC